MYKTIIFFPIPSAWPILSMITLGVGDKALIKVPSVITLYRVYYESSTNMERELYFDFYCLWGDHFLNGV